MKCKESRENDDSIFRKRSVVYATSNQSGTVCEMWAVCSDLSVGRDQSGKR